MVALNNVSFLLLIFFGIILFSGCVEPIAKSDAGGTNISTISRGFERNVSAEKSVIDANNRFAFDLYSNMSRNPDNNGRNIFFSPLSISSVFAITYEGARTKTAEEIRTVFHLPADDLTRRQGFKDIFMDLNQENDNNVLHTANALWTEKTRSFLPEFSETARNCYAADTRDLDFIHAPEVSRGIINTWAAEKTSGKILELVPEGMIDTQTGLVITNAVYFNRTWVNAFNKSETEEDTFMISTSNPTQVKMMHLGGNTAIFPYAETVDMQAVVLPYETINGKNLSMLVILPKENDLKTVESILNISGIEKLRNSLRPQQIDLYFPKFALTTAYELPGVLSAMGMPTGFSSDADFSGINGQTDMYIHHAIHKTMIDVNEQGTETASATAAIVDFGSPPVFGANHPFVLLIQDDETGNILFIGRVVNPNS